MQLHSYSIWVSRKVKNKNWHIYRFQPSETMKDQKNVQISNYSKGLLCKVVVQSKKSEILRKKFTTLSWATTNEVKANGEVSL